MAERIKIDEGEIRYEFRGFHAPSSGSDPFIRATFKGPRLGTEFEMGIAEARQMRADLDAAIARFEAAFPRFAFCGDENRLLGTRCILPRGHDGRHNGEDEHHRAFSWEGSSESEK